MWRLIRPAANMYHVEIGLPSAIAIGDRIRNLQRSPFARLCLQVQAFLSPPVEGVVLQTYGAGNGPSARVDIMNELRKANDRGVLLLNCSQCPNGAVDPAYETGNVS